MEFLENPSSDGNDKKPSGKEHFDARKSTERLVKEKLVTSGTSEKSIGNKPTRNDTDQTLVAGNISEVFPISTDAIRERYQEPITKEKVQKIYDQYKEDVIRQIASGAHPSHIWLTDNGVIVKPEEDLAGRINLDINKAEAYLAEGRSNFRRKGKKGIHYMVKRADGDELDMLTNLTVAHLIESKHGVLAISDEGEPGSNKQMVELWKKVRETYEQRRNSKPERQKDRKYCKLRHFTERQRLEINPEIAVSWKLRNIKSYFYWKRPLKQSIAMELQQEQARDNHLKEKQQLQDEKKIKKFLRRVMGYKPLEERVSRLRGRIGKEQSLLREAKKIREDYEEKRYEIHELRVMNDLPYQKIEQEIERLYGGENRNTNEAKDAFFALKSFKDEYMKGSGKLLNVMLEAMHLQYKRDMETMERRIVKQLKTFWNDLASIGSSPVTSVGTALSIAGAVGAIA